MRELEVMLLMLAELRESGRCPERSLAPITRAVSAEHDEARKRLRAKLPPGELERLAGKLDDLARRLEAEGSSSKLRDEKAWRWAMDARIARRAERLDRAMREAGAVYLPDRLHAVRIAAKKLRYAVELWAEAAGVKGLSDLRTLRRAQDALGRMHDLQVLIDRVRQVQASLLPADSSVWDALDALIDSLEDDCRRLHAHYMRARPALAAVCAQLLARPHAGSAARTLARRAG